ncbi:hypothetical protein ACR6C2_25285 [Streptomyces sp. INA 01156]
MDVWGPRAPAVRIRRRTASTATPRAVQGAAPDGRRGDGGTRPPARLRKSRSAVEVRLPGQHWVLRRENSASSWLLRDERRVALLTRPPRWAAPAPDTVLLPLSPVRYESTDPLDAVMAHAFAVAFGLGDTTGSARFPSDRRPVNGGEPLAADKEWTAPGSPISAEASTTSPVAAAGRLGFRRRRRRRRWWWRRR